MTSQSRRTTNRLAAAWLTWRTRPATVFLRDPEHTPIVFADHRSSPALDAPFAVAPTLHVAETRQFVKLAMLARSH